MKFGKIVCVRLGGPEVLTLAEEELRAPSAGELRVRVEGAGVAWADCMMRRGNYPAQPKPPFTPGYDVVGVIDEVGPGVTRAAKGQRVAALTVRNGYAEYVYLPEKEVVPVPAGVEPASAVCLVLNYVTAYQMLHRVARAKAGDSILVHSAAGGVGTALLELARIAEIRTIGTASKGKHALIESLGATALDRAGDFVRETRRIEPQGVSAVFDPIGGAHWLQSWRCLKRGGRLIAFGSQGASKFADVLAAIPLYVLPGRKFEFYAITNWKANHPSEFREDLEALFSMLADGTIKPVIGATLPWQQAAEANRMLEAGAVRGKIVLTF